MSWIVDPPTLPPGSYGYDIVVSEPPGRENRWQRASLSGLAWEVGLLRYGKYYPNDYSPVWRTREEAEAVRSQLLPQAQAMGISLAVEDATTSATGHLTFDSTRGVDGWRIPHYETRIQECTRLRHWPEQQRPAKDFQPHREPIEVAWHLHQMREVLDRQPLPQPSWQQRYVAWLSHSRLYMQWLRERIYWDVMDVHQTRIDKWQIDLSQIDLTMSPPVVDNRCTFHWSCRTLGPVLKPLSGTVDVLIPEGAEHQDNHFVLTWTERVLRYSNSP